MPSASSRSRSRSGEPVGVTTVSASLALAAAVGIDVFATGGIGGVHRGAERTGDVSADLGAIAAHPVVTVSSGAKAFLDLPRTLEHLESRGVPVLGWRPTSSRCSGAARVGCRCRSASRTRRGRATSRARYARSALRRGVLLAVPIPEQDAIDPTEIEAAIAAAIARERSAGERGAAVTPRILAAIARGDRRPDGPGQPRPGRAQRRGRRVGRGRAFTQP